VSHLKTFAHGENFTSPQVKLHFCSAKTSLAAHAANFTAHRSVPILRTAMRKKAPRILGSYANAGSFFYLFLIWH